MANQPTLTPLLEAILNSGYDEVEAALQISSLQNESLPQPSPVPAAFTGDPSLATLPELLGIARPPAQRNWRQYATRDIDCVWVNPVSGVQTIEKRFGPKARKRIYSYLRKTIHEEDWVDDENQSGSEAEDGIDVDIESNENAFNDNDDDILSLVSDDGLGTQTDSQDASVSANDSGVSNVETSESPSPEDDNSIDNGDTTSSDFDSTSSGTDGSAAHHPATDPSYPIALHGTCIPHVARARLNLTALSAKYNLYFASYQNKIHVYRPQPAPEILHGPLLVLSPLPTKAAGITGGYISLHVPHQANHLIIGDLGDDEILLLAYDDGDVFAYYTRHIFNYVSSVSRRAQRARHAPKLPQPFFRETVGMSAWGLAIHSQSRLIAVSSNLGEVNVFAFALKQSKPGDPQQHKTQPLIVPEVDPSPVALPEVSALELEALFRLRDREWRILLPLGVTSSNVPCVAFIDDVNGNAEKVIAVDIQSSTWILDIWKVGSRPLKLTSPNKLGREMGWGVMVIPKKEFLTTKKMPPAPSTQMPGLVDHSKWTYGLNFSYENDPLKPKPIFKPPSYNTSSHEYKSDSDSDVSMAEDDRTSQRTFLFSDDGESDSDASGGSDESDSDEGGSDSEAEAAGELVGEPAAPHGSNAGPDGPDKTAYTFDPTTMSRNWDALVHQTRAPNATNSVNLKKSDTSTTGFHLGMTICPSLGLTWPPTTLQTLIHTLRNAQYRRDKTREDIIYHGQHPDLKEMEDFARHFYIMRTFSSSIEIFNIDRSIAPFFVQNVVMMGQLPSSLWDMSPQFHRCSMLHYIPEINLILVGNMMGRVVLLRPIRNKGRPSRAGDDAPNFIFRTEWTLPLLRDDHLGNRPPCCLLGMAVSRVPEPGAGEYGLRSTKKRVECGKWPPSLRWRVLLHYMDHTILQYYIEAKKPGTGQLRVL